MINQDRITSSFSRSARTYHEESSIQKAAAEVLAGMLVKRLEGQLEHAVEFGAGTGHFTLSLLAENPRPARIFEATDPSPAMLEQCALNLAKAAASDFVRMRVLSAQQWTAESGARVDLIAGASFIQWLEDPIEWLAQASFRLKPGALAAFSAYGRNNLREVGALSGGGLKGLSREDLEELSGFYEVLDYAEEIRSERFPDAASLLRHLSRTGVNACSKSPLTKSGLAELMRGLEERFSDEDGVRLTWNPVYFILKTR